MTRAASPWRALVPRSPERLQPFDEVAAALAPQRVCVAEEDALRTLWGGGEDGRLHEDPRFVHTGHDRWHLATQTVANETLYCALLKGWDGRDLEGRLAQLDAKEGGIHVFDPGDPRLHVVEGDGRLALVSLPLRIHEERPEDGRPAAPLVSIQAAAGQLGGGDEEWMSRGYVVLKDAVPTDAFLVRVEGRSMEPRIAHGAYLLVRPGPADSGVVLASHRELSDPDLGTCTVKAIRKTASGGCELVAENPAWRDRPLLLGGVSWTEVRIFAHVERVLGPLDFAELDLPPEACPRPPRPPLTPEELGRRLDALARRRGALGNPPKPPPGPAGEPPPPPTGGPATADRCELALAADGKTLRLRVPAVDLPPEVRFVDVGGCRTRAVNLRHGYTASVAPRTRPYEVQATGVPAEVAARLASLTAPGLEDTRATVFRAPAAGSGARREDGALRPGRIYRLLVPPALAKPGAAIASAPWVERLGAIEAWAVLEIEVPDAEDGEADRLLAALGLARRSRSVRLDLVGAAPVRIERLEGGLDVFVFDRSRLPRVAVSTDADCAAGSVHLLVASEGETARIALGAGRRWVIALEDVAPGVVVIEGRESDREVDHDQIVIRVEANARSSPPPEARFRVLSGEAPVEGPAPSARNWTGEIGQLAVELPPLWSLAVRWGEDAWAGGSQTLRADEDGGVDLDATRATIQAFLAGRWLAWIELDAGDLGTVRLVHEARATPAEVARSIARLEDDAELALREMLPIETVATRWVLPIARALGYEPAPTAAGDLEVALLRRRIGPSGPVKERFGRLRVIRSPGAGGQVEALAQVVRSAGEWVAIVTDGDLWLRVDPAGYISRRIEIDLGELLRSGDEAKLVRFVEAFGA